MDFAGDFALFIIGFFFLIQGSSILVDGAISLSRLWKVSSWVIGVIIIGIGTSLPEFSINLASAFSGSSIGLGTIIGGNVFNLLLVIGVVAFLSPLRMDAVWVWKDFTVNAAVVSFAALLFVLPGGAQAFYGISRSEGFVLLMLFLVWIWYMVSRTRDAREEKTDYKAFTFSVSLIMVVFGLVGVFLGGKWVVDGGIHIARLIGASDALIGLTLVGIGTSLPELVISITAAIKGKAPLAIGNIIGSNIFDFLGILGIVSLFRPIPFSFDLSLPLLFLVFGSLALFVSQLVIKRYVFNRFEGALFIALYVLYITNVIR